MESPSPPSSSVKSHACGVPPSLPSGSVPSANTLGCVSTPNTDDATVPTSNVSPSLHPDPPSDQGRVSSAVPSSVDVEREVAQQSDPDEEPPDPEPPPLENLARQSYFQPPLLETIVEDVSVCDDIDSSDQGRAAPGRADDPFDWVNWIDQEDTLEINAVNMSPLPQSGNPTDVYSYHHGPADYDPDALRAMIDSGTFANCIGPDPTPLWRYRRIEDLPAH